MKTLFEIIILEEAFEFLKTLDKKHSEKILYNIRKAQLENDPELFKKLNTEIWELRTHYNGLHYRLLAFGIKRIKQKHLLLQHTVLSRKEARCQKMKSKNLRQ
jgi:mRNA-degrading endonuclease RelE of RelBE toxin-antitoxin system